MRVIYYVEALDELLESIDYYQNKERELGAYLYSDLSNTLDLLKNNPNLGKTDPEHPHLQSIPLNVFPFTIIYHMSDGHDILYIVAVAHQRRGPDYWSHRL